MKTFDVKSCMKIYQKDYREKNKERIKKQRQEFYAKNSERLLTEKSEYYQKNKFECLSKVKERYKKDYKMINKKNWERVKNKRQQNPHLRTISNLRRRMVLAIKENGGYKSDKTFDLISCKPEFLKKYLESKFTEGMSWETHGLKGWHIDHIIPCAAFDLTNVEEQKKCFHYTNLQPLWWNENLSKGNKQYVSE